MNQVYRKEEIVRRVVKKLNGTHIVIGGNKYAYKRKYHLKFSKFIVSKVIGALMDVLVEVLEEGDSVNFRGYMTIEPRYCKATRARDINRNLEIQVPPKYKPKVHFGRLMENACKNLTERELGGTNNEES